MENEMVFKDDISAMRYGMESALQDLKWHELEARDGVTMYTSPGDSVRFAIASAGTVWQFAYDDSQAHPEVTYKVFAHGDTWKEFERALYLAQAIEEEKLGARRDLIGKWWDSWLPVNGLGSERLAGRGDRRHWFASRKLYVAPAAFTSDAWRTLSGHECETIEREVLKGITK